MPSRRSLLTSASLVPLVSSGCLGLSSNNETSSTETKVPDQDHDNVPDSEDDYPDNYVAAETVVDVSETVTIPPGDFEAYSISADRSGQILYEFLAQGGPIDLLFMDSEDYTKWQKGDPDSEYRIVLSFIDSASDWTEQLLPAGDWVLVLDHTEAQTLPNESPVEVDIDLEVGLESETKPTAN